MKNGRGFLLYFIFVLFALGLIVVSFRNNILSTNISAEPSRKNLELTFLDVGQGDSILIRTPFGQNILIDGGEDEQLIKKMGAKMDWWDKKIDLLILTHPHSDHVGGLMEVLKRYDVMEILYTGATHNSPDYIAFLELIKEKNIKLRIINKAQTIKFGDNCVLNILYPMNQNQIDSQDNLNNTSIVAKLVYDKNSFLFVGDAEEKVEKILIDSGVDLQADVLKVGHHASDTSSSEIFLKMVKPKYAVIEVGKDNTFGHPSLRILRRLEKLPTKIYRTDLDGDIDFVSDGKTVLHIE